MSQINKKRVTKIKETYKYTPVLSSKDKMAMTTQQVITNKILTGTTLRGPDKTLTEKKIDKARIQADNTSCKNAINFE